MTKRFIAPLWLLPFLCYGVSLFAQPVATRTATSSEIQLKLKHLNVLGSVLYIAAHPDDENTRMLATLALEKGYETSYLSLTRGDGGQNLIGSEQGVELGLIRTQELLAARHLDGAHQYFSSAYDFGFSKNPEETFTIWDREKVLGEVVWVIRTLKPDVIITRFNPEPSNTHGHHTASAQLALEAFSAAADPNKYPEQLRYTEVWQAKRILWNTSWFFYGTRDFDKTGLLKMDVGAYLPQLGQSVGERAGESRSQHRSQGFGSARQRGEEPEYLKPLAGEPATTDIMDGVSTGWKRVKGSETVEKLVQQAIAEYQTDKPEASLPLLLNIRKELKKLGSSYWRDLKLRETEYLITQCAGFFGEALLPTATVILGDSLKLKVEMLVRNPYPVKLGRVFVATEPLTVDKILETNKTNSMVWAAPTPGHLVHTQPFWLRNPKSKGMFNAGNPQSAVRAFDENPIPVFAELYFGTDTDPLTVKIPTVYKYTEPDRGELFSYPELVPEFSVNLTDPVLVLKPGETRKATFKVIHHSKKSTGEVRLVFRTEGDLKTDVPYVAVGNGLYGFVVKPETLVEVNVTAGPLGGTLYPKVEWESFAPSPFREGGARFDSQSDRSFRRISYTHIPNLVLQPTAELRVQTVPVKTSPLRIGYVKGAGDEVPGVLRQLGYTVDEVSDAQLSADYLKKYDVVLMGIRAYNTRDALAQKNGELLAYVQNGGRLVVQYNTTGELVTPNIGPYPFKITRNRITVEETPLTVLDPAHPLFNTPNKITTTDFDGWVQERGLYFVGDADKAYTKLLKGQDPKEAESDGLLLYAQYGKGQFVYTGLSFFRQLPAGNPGAIRLFVNLLEPNKAKP